MQTVGLVTNYFFKKYSVRGVALFGAMIFMSGSVWATFARSMVELIFAFGVLEGRLIAISMNRPFLHFCIILVFCIGAGFGLMIAASYTTFNAYFVTKRIRMMSVAQSLYGMAAMAYPLFVHYFMEEFGYRGFMAIRAGFHGHVIFGMLAMHPVEWHMKEVLAEDELLVEGD